MYCTVFHVCAWFLCLMLIGAFASLKEYIPVLSRPQVLQNVKRFVWGSIYYDYLVLTIIASNYQCCLVFMCGIK